MRCALPLLAAAARALTPEEHDAARQRFVDEINSKQSLWRAGHSPHFRGKPIGASKPMLGVKPDAADVHAAAIRDGRLRSVTTAEPGFVAPDTFDAAEQWPQCAKMIRDIRDQSNCGCCWAFGGAEAASDRLCIQTNATTVLPLSAQDLCFCSNPNGCGGGYVNAAWEYIKSSGLVTGSQQQPDDGKTDPFSGMGLCSSFSLPHCHHHGPTGSDPYPAEGAAGCPSEQSAKCPTACDSGAKAPHNDFGNDKFVFTGDVVSPNGEAAIQQEVMRGGPIEVAFTVYSDFETYSSGVYKHTSSQSVGGHAVKLVGWGVDSGVKYWKIANSWNPYWGENGHFRIVRGTNECGIESQTGANGAGSWCNVKKTACTKEGDCCGTCGSGDCQATCKKDGTALKCCPKNGMKKCPFDTCAGCSKQCGGGSSTCNSHAGDMTCQCTSNPSKSCSSAAAC